MKHISKIIVLCFLLLLVAALGATTTDTSQAEEAHLGMESFLWEPGWSPFTVPRGLRGSADAWDGDGANGLISYDIDRDGQDELLLGGDDIHVLDILRDTASTQWSRLSIGDPSDTEGLFVHWIGIEDINADGQDELVLVSYPDKLRIFRYDTSAKRYYEINPDSPRFLLGPLFSLAFIDHNDDGYMDIVGCDYEPGVGGAYVLYGDTSGGLGELVPINGPIESMWAAAQGTYSGEQGTWLLSQDSLWFALQGETHAEKVHNVGGTDLVVADVDADGNVEVIVAAGKYMYIWRTAEDGLTLLEEIHLPNDVECLLAGDFDADGCLDLCLVDSLSSEYILLFNRAGRFGEAMLRQKTKGGLSFRSIPVVGDFDGDGRTDFAYTDGSRHIGLAMSAATGYALQPFPGSSVIGTVEDDLLCGTSDGRIFYLENSGIGIFSPRVLVNKPAVIGEEAHWWPLAAQFADVTASDGEELVVLGESEATAHIVVWEKEEDVWTQAFVCALDTFYDTLVIADIDGNAGSEIVVASEKGFTICTDSRFPGSDERVGGIQFIEWENGLLVRVAAYSSNEVLGFGTNINDRTTVLLRLQSSFLSEVQILSELVVPGAMVIVDLNGDEKDDIILVGLKVSSGEEESLYELVVVHLLATEDGTFEEEYLAVPATLNRALPVTALAGDFDGNGTFDLAIVLLSEVLGSTQQLVILPFDGEAYGGIHIGHASIHPNPIPLDVDGDGKIEIIQAQNMHVLSIIRIGERQ